MNELNRKNILILDPERDIGELFARALEVRRNFKCYFAGGEQEALNLLKEIPFDLILADLAVTMTGDFGLLRKIRKLSPESFIVIDGYLHQKQGLDKALALGASGYIIKPIKLDIFRKKIEEFCAEAASPPM